MNLTTARVMNQPESALPQVTEWRSGQSARVKLHTKEYEGAVGRIRAVVDGAAWMEFQQGNAEFNARIPLEKLVPMDGAAAAAREVMQREANKFGGVVVDVECTSCGGTISGHVVTDPGEPAGSSPAVPAHLYVAQFVRNCNCSVPRSEIERDLIVAAALAAEES